MDQYDNDILDFFLHNEDFTWSQHAEVQQQQILQQHTGGTMPAAQTFTAVDSAIPLIPLQLHPYSPLHDPPFNLSGNSVEASMAQPQSLPLRPQEASSTLGQPKIRKKPGRKPNPATPFLRKAQNRAAQRAFRERKEKHLRDLEILVQSLKKERKAMAKELLRARNDVRTYKAECCYLKGLLLTLHLVCLHHDITIPNHTPFMSMVEVNEMGRKSPFVIDAYELAQKQYETEMRELMNNDLSIGSLGDGKACDELITNNDEGDAFARKSNVALTSPKGPSESAAEVAAAAAALSPETSLNEENRAAIVPAATSPETSIMTKEQEAIGQLRHQLRIQAKDPTIDTFTSGLRPSFLQMIVPHDARIDLIPNAYMRDRLILFRDLIDYETCFKTLINGSVFHGTDPTDPTSWEVSVDFLSEYWYLCAKYDGRYHKGWCILKSLLYCDDVSRESMNDDMTRDLRTKSYGDIFNEFVDIIPSLHPQHDDNTKAITNQNNHSRKATPYIMFRSPPALRDPIQSPTLDTMVEIMNIPHSPQAEI
ncbi:hypothetical protein BX666DRAFT_1892887 [Dichotomocladium elegans]|nr:hypothetical protein BX666DRAFT_1892887 [Dichotomocladium elegans]